MFEPPALGDACPCGSGRAFGECCHESPREIFVAHNALPARRCDDMVKYLRTQPKRWVSIISQESDGLGQKESRSGSRVTQYVKKGKLSKRISKLVEANFLESVSAAGSTLAWYEDPNILYYTEGGTYGAHADAEVKNPQDDGWTRILDRDFSLLLYLSDEFEGGNITFNRFGYSFKPRKGDVVVFPSDHRYIHTAEPVTSGHRYVIVSWCATTESRKVSPVPPEYAIPVART